MSTSMRTTASVPVTRKVVSRISPIFRNMTGRTHPQIMMAFPLMKARKKMKEGQVASLPTDPRPSKTPRCAGLASIFA